MINFGLAATLFLQDIEGDLIDETIDSLETIAREGFQKTELLADGISWKPPDPRTTSKLRKALERFDVDPSTIHTPMKGIDLSSPDVSVRKASVKRISEAMRFAADVGVRTAIVHPTGKPGVDGRRFTLENLGAAMENIYKSMGTLVEVAEQTAVRIALENLSGAGAGYRPLDTMQELRAFISGFPEERVGLCLDVGHACISGYDPANQARVASDRLLALHIHDVDGTRDCHWVPGKGVVDWTSLGDALTDIDFDGDWTIEVLTVHTDSPLESVTEECGAIRRLWEERGMCNPE
jgi:sugar phosphate isomerase/epimerase